MWRRMVYLVAAIVVAACQSTGTPSTAPTQAAAATSSPTTAPMTPAATKPITLPRVADLPLDGTCEEDNVSCLGSLVAGKAYTTKVFTPATTFKVPTSDWVNPAEVGGDFGLLSTRDIGDAIMFFRDARSFDKSAGDTVTELASWLETYDKLTVTPFEPVKVGGLSGVWMDVRIKAPSSTADDPNCPVQVCVPILRGDDPVANDPYQWHWDWGAAGTEVQRLYLLQAEDMVIAISVDSRDGLTFDALTDTFDKIAPTIAFS